MSALELAALLGVVLCVALALIVAAAYLVAAVAALIERCTPWTRWPLAGKFLRYGVPHNMIGHPLLVVCRPLGEWVHRRTRDSVPTIPGRLMLRQLPQGAELTEHGWHVDPARSTSSVVIAGTGDR